MHECQNWMFEVKLISKFTDSVGLGFRTIQMRMRLCVRILTVLTIWACWCSWLSLPSRAFDFRPKKSDGWEKRAPRRYVDGSSTSSHSSSFSFLSRFSNLNAEQVISNFCDLPDSDCVCQHFFTWGRGVRTLKWPSPRKRQFGRFRRLVSLLEEMSSTFNFTILQHTGDDDRVVGNPSHQGVIQPWIPRPIWRWCLCFAYNSDSYRTLSDHLETKVWLTTLYL